MPRIPSSPPPSTAAAGTAADPRRFSDWSAVDVRGIGPGLTSTPMVCLEVALATVESAGSKVISAVIGSDRSSALQRHPLLMRRRSFMRTYAICTTTGAIIHLNKQL